TLVYAQICYWSYRQVQLKWRPVVTAVPRNKQTELGARKQKVLSHVVLTHHARKCSCRQAIVDLGPGVSVVGGFVQARSVIVELVTRRRDVGRCLVVRRHFDRVDQTLREA